MMNWLANKTFELGIKVAGKSVNQLLATLTPDQRAQALVRATLYRLQTKIDPDTAPFAEIMLDPWRFSEEECKSLMVVLQELQFAADANCSNLISQYTRMTGNKNVAELRTSLYIHSLWARIWLVTVGARLNFSIADEASKIWEFLAASVPVLPEAISLIEEEENMNPISANSSLLGYLRANRNEITQSATQFPKIGIAG